MPPPRKVVKSSGTAGKRVMGRIKKKLKAPFKEKFSNEQKKALNALVLKNLSKNTFQLNKQNCSNKYRMVLLEETELNLTLIACVPTTDNTNYTDEAHKTKFYLLNNTTYTITDNSSNSSTTFLPKISTAGISFKNPALFLYQMEADYDVLFDLASGLNTTGEGLKRKLSEIRYIIETRRFARKYFFGGKLNLGQGQLQLESHTGFLNIIESNLKRVFMLLQRLKTPTQTNQELYNLGLKIVYNFLYMLENIQLLEVELPYISVLQEHWTFGLITKISKELEDITDIKEYTYDSYSKDLVQEGRLFFSKQILYDNPILAIEAPSSSGCGGKVITKGKRKKKKSLKRKNKQGKKSRKQYSRKLRRKSTRAR